MTSRDKQDNLTAALPEEMRAREFRFDTRSPGEPLGHTVRAGAVSQRDAVEHVVRR